MHALGFSSFPRSNRNQLRNLLSAPSGLSLSGPSTIEPVQLRLAFRFVTTSSGASPPREYRVPSNHPRQQSLANQIALTCPFLPLPSPQPAVLVASHSDSFPHSSAPVTHPPRHPFPAGPPSQTCVTAPLTNPPPRHLSGGTRSRALCRCSCDLTSLLCYRHALICARCPSLAHLIVPHRILSTPRILEAHTLHPKLPDICVPSMRLRANRIDIGFASHRSLSLPHTSRAVTGMNSYTHNCSYNS